MFNLKTMLPLFAGLALSLVSVAPASAHTDSSKRTVSECSDNGKFCAAATPAVSLNNCGAASCTDRVVTDDEILGNTDGATTCRKGGTIFVRPSGIFCDICFEPVGAYVTGQRIVQAVRLGAFGSGHRVIRESATSIVVVYSGDVVGRRFTGTIG